MIEGKGEIPKRSIWSIALLLVVAGCGSRHLPSELVHLSAEIPEEISYNFHIRPILSDRCLNCHGPDANKREADLRLDKPASAFATGRESPAIVPNSPRQSALYTRILSTDPKVVMPPPESKLVLSDYEKAVLIRWIDQGAQYDTHWALKSEHHEAPANGSHPIDYFIDKSLATQNLKKNAPANREALIRRVSFDLTGLPPTLEDIDQFVQSEDPDAYVRLVDRLLSSKSYGERMAADWMDVARYADSDGYLDDKHRDFSPWRDWVISAFNENMPYDKFVTWQLAGDLLPTPSRESILATAFNRLHRKNSEAGIVFEEYRVEYVADRVHTFGKAFLGLTLECARCHDHKYDPISQKEYYQLFAFFNRTDEMGTAIYGPDQTPGPTLLLSSTEQQQIINFLSEKIDEKENHLNTLTDNFDVKEIPSVDISKVSQKYTQKLVAHHSFDAAEKTPEGTYQIRNKIPGKPHAILKGEGLGTGFEGRAFYIQDYSTVTLGEKIGWFDRSDPFSVSLYVYPDQKYPEAGLFTHCEDLRLGYKGYGLHLIDNSPHFIIAHSWPYNSIEVVAKKHLSPGEWTQVTVTYDGSSKASGVQIYLNGENVEYEVIRDNLYKGILYEPNIHTYGFQGFRLGYRDKIKNLKNGAVDELKIFGSELSPLEVLFGFNPELSADQNTTQDLWREFVLKNLDEKFSELRDSLKLLRENLTKTINTVPEIMVMGDSPKPKSTHVLNRGSYLHPGEEVQAKTPEALSPPFGRFSTDRLGLAEWLFSDDNSLTARVYANRIWQQHFGRGLVKTTEDFGSQGSLPTHPELLDYLATYLRNTGWDIKALHKLILTSDVYRRSSMMPAAHLKNAQYAAGPSMPLSAEMIRDNALSISQLLVDSIGGPSVYPYQPEGLWDEISNKVWRYPYRQHPGPGLYRRSLYTIWKRTSAPPSMLIFDAPDRSFCTVKRARTNTPQQALVLLNDVQYIEAARIMAAHTFDQEDNINDQIIRLCRLAWGRPPDKTEMHALLEYYEQEVELSSPDQLAYFENGNAELRAEVKIPQVKALATIAHNLLNTHEAQMK